MDGTSHQSDKFVLLKSITTSDGSIVELPTKQFRVQMVNKPKSDPKVMKPELRNNPDVPELVQIKPAPKSMVRLTSFSNGDNNKNRLLPIQMKQATIIKLPTMDNLIPTMPRLIPVAKLSSIASSSGLNSRFTPQRVDGSTKIMMKTPDGKQFVLKSQGLYSSAPSMPALSTLPRRIAKPLPQPPKLHVTGSDSDETTETKDPEKVEVEKEISQILPNEKMASSCEFSTIAQQQNNNNGKLELQQVKRTYGRNSNLFPQRDTPEFSALMNTQDSIASQIEKSHMEDSDSDDLNSDDSDVFKGFLNERSSPDIESAPKINENHERLIDVSGIIGVQQNSTEPTRNHISIQDLNQLKIHALAIRNSMNSRPTSPLVNKRLDTFINNNTRIRSKSLCHVESEEGSNERKLSTSSDTVPTPTSKDLKFKMLPVLRPFSPVSKVVQPKLPIVSPLASTTTKLPVVSEPIVVELMCDEKIDDNTPENSPEGKEEQVEAPISHPTLVKNLKMNLNRKLSEAGKQPEESKVAPLTDYDDFLTKSEIHKNPIELKKPKVVKKQKRKVEEEPKVNQVSKVKDKAKAKGAYKLENIKFIEGIGSLQDCRKRFNFNEFGLLEIYNGPDVSSDLANDKRMQLKFEQQVGNASSPTVQCKICNKTGSTQGFLKEDCCSFICQTIAHSKGRGSVSSTGSQTPPSRNSPLPQAKITPAQQQSQNDLLMEQLQGLMHTNKAEMEEVDDDKKKLELERNQVLLKQLYQKQQEKKRKLMVETDGKIEDADYLREDRNTVPAEKGIFGTNRYYQANNKDMKFRWDMYLTHRNTPAPLGLFINPYPSTGNLFQIGMKLEAIDPHTQSLFCVCTVEQKLGFRLKLHFDGYSNVFDFWVNADSMDIFPPGWCNSTGRALQAPPNYKDGFDWTQYLDANNSTVAPKVLFTHLNSTTSPSQNNFERAMKLLVHDKKTRKHYISTVMDVLDNRILVHYDEMDEQYSYWIETNSPRISPINAQIDPTNVVIPSSYDSRQFNWVSYMRSSGGRFAPSTNFCKRLPFEFAPGMKLEVVDKSNPQLIRPATVLKSSDYQLLIVFDGFEIFYSYWIDDDSVDIHPINWCDKTMHPIEHPAGYGHQNGLCEILGCRGIGNVLNRNKYFHDSVKDCPYLKQNWVFDDQQPVRVLTNEIQQFISLSSSNTKKMPHNIALNKMPSKPKLVGRPRGVLKEQKNKSDIDKNEDSHIEHHPKGQRKGQNKRSSASAANSEQDEPIRQKRRKLPNYVPTTTIRIDTSKEHLLEYGPQLQYAQKLWTNHSKVLQKLTDENNKVTKNPLYWTVNDVSNYVAKLPNCANYAQIFSTSMIDGQAFLMLSQDDLIKELNIKFGPAVKIYNRIVFLREEIMLDFLQV